MDVLPSPKPYIPKLTRQINDKATHCKALVAVRSRRSEFRLRSLQSRVDSAAQAEARVRCGSHR